MPTTNWNRPSHDAQQYGTKVVNALLGNRTFPYPKSLYAVEDALRFFVGGKPNAVVVDFFAGSGTTASQQLRARGCLREPFSGTGFKNNRGRPSWPPR